MQQKPQKTSSKASKAPDKLDVYMVLKERPQKPVSEPIQPIKLDSADKVGVYLLVQEHPLKADTRQEQKNDEPRPEVHTFARNLVKEFGCPEPTRPDAVCEEKASAPEIPDEIVSIPKEPLPCPEPKTEIPPAPQAEKVSASTRKGTVPSATEPKQAVVSPEEIPDVLLSPRGDRRLLSNVPDAEKIRTNVDRRGQKTLEDFDGDVQAYVKSYQMGLRYEVHYPVQVSCRMKKGRRRKFTATGIDISTTGILLQVGDARQTEILKNARSVRLKFKIEPGTMPEGYEMPVRIGAVLVREVPDENGRVLCGMQFEDTLAQYASRTRQRYMLTMSAILLFIISLFVVLMRAESVIYFEFNKLLYFYSIVAAIFLLSRYWFGAQYKPVPVDPNFTPGVTIIIPCFNEEQWIEQTITSCLNQDYPIDKLEVIIVDDYSTDRSVEVIHQTVERLHNEVSRFKTHDRISYVVQEKNAGKRDALARGAELAKHELLVFVDSDSFLDPFAIRNLVQPFKDPKMGGVSGRTDVANTFTNALTKMQSVRYYIAFRIMKAAEAYFDTVTCLSGPLACYRKDIVLEHKDEWLNQRFLGQRATFGDDRSMTNFVLRKHRTGYQDTAVCSTIVPNQYNVFLKQQMRWKRSWLRESILAGKFMWKKEPFASVLFYIGLLVPVAAPVIVLYNLIYVPITQHIFPLTFLVGLLMMSLLMSFAQLFLRKSSTWTFGLLFCLFYEGVLLWQMPVAWFTFWKSTWGTRMTPEDVKAKEKRDERRLKHKRKKDKNPTEQV